MFSLMGQRHVCTFRLAQRAAYRTAISAAQTCFHTKTSQVEKMQKRATKFIISLKKYSYKDRLT